MLPNCYGCEESTPETLDVRQPECAEGIVHEIHPKDHMELTASVGNSSTVTLTPVGRKARPKLPSPSVPAGIPLATPSTYLLSI